MAPLECCLSDLSSIESKDNFNVLSERFPQLVVLPGGKRLIPNPQYNSELMRFCNDSGEELYIYPEEDKWYLKKEQKIEEGLFSFFDSIYLIPQIDEKGELKVVVPDSMGGYCANRSNNIDLPLLRSLYSSRSNYFYGEVEPCLSGERGFYYESVEEYREHRKIFEQMSGLNISDLYLILSNPGTSSGVGEIPYGDLQLGIELSM